MDVARALTHLPIVQELPAAARRRIVATASVVELRAGDEIWDRGQAASAFMFLIEGQVRLVVSKQKHREFLVDLIDSPGELVCVPAVCSAAPHCCGAVSVRNSTLLSVPREELLPEDTTTVGSLLLRQSASRAMSLCRRLREVGGGKVQQRVAAVLLRLTDERGILHEGKMLLPNTISRRDLAGLSGCATETLIRVLASLEREGIISRSDEGLVIDVRLLATHAHSN